MDASSLRQVFDSALEIEDPIERDQYILQVCEKDQDLADRIHRLLGFHTKSLKQEKDGTDAEVSASQLYGTHAGHSPGDEGIFGSDYQVTVRLGEGGTCEVFEAWQRFPSLQKVAIKLIKLGLDSRETLVRFAQERTILEQLKHPNIANILGADTTPTGRPFIVMELVQGEAINEFVTSRTLDLRERLELFIVVCKAVGYANSRGVVHRDLKPGNVLVKMVQETPVPVLVDFGIAKCRAQTDSDEGLKTHPGQLIGTLDYMSPEQASLGDESSDARTDVYGLSAILYELICGSTVFYDEIRRSESLFSALQIIRLSCPISPSQATKSKTDLCRRWALSRRQWQSLDAIVLKGLQKKRENRYSSAEELSNDLQRFLRNERVSAERPVRLTEQSIIWSVACLVVVSLFAIVAVYSMQSSVELPPIKRITEAGSRSDVDQNGVHEQNSAVRPWSLKPGNTHAARLLQEPFESCIRKLDYQGALAVVRSAYDQTEYRVCSEQADRLFGGLKEDPEKYRKEIFNIRILKARSVIELGEHDLGAAILDELQAELGNVGEILVARAWSHVFRGRNADARAVTEGLTADGDSDLELEVRYLRGVIESREGNFESAAQLFDTEGATLQRSNPFLSAKFRRAAAENWFWAGKRKEAIAGLEQLRDDIKSNRICAENHFLRSSTQGTLIDVYIESGRYEEGFEETQDLLSYLEGPFANPKALKQKDAINLRRILCCILLRRMDDAKVILDQLPELEDNDSRFQKIAFLAACYRDAGNIHAAESCAIKTRELLSTLPESKKWKGRRNLILKIAEGILPENEFSGIR